MASYETWNTALLSYFIEGVPRSSTIFLSIDNDILAQVGRSLTHEATARLPGIAETAPDLAAVRDFCAAIRSCVVESQERINLRAIRGRNGRGEPAGLAFLCAMVLAASWMAEEEDISEINYFRRLREVLALSSGEGRPPGMSPGGDAEEPLWLEWNRWLQEHGYLPSADHGDGPRKYINYPLSQALLRHADKDRLCSLFYERQWLRDWDADTLFVHVQREAHHLPQHLRELLNAQRQRRQAVAEAIYELHEFWRENLYSGAVRLGSGSTNLRAGLFRIEDALFGTIAYHLYPRALRGRAPSQIQVRQDDKLWSLVPDQPGWYQPLGPLSEDELDAGTRYRIEQPQDLGFLVLPQRRFWILVQDPENPESGAYASWTGPQLAEPFILLTKRDLLPQLEHLRGEGLIEWSGEPEPLFSGKWVEIRDCMAVSEAWSGVFIDDQELYEALRPSMTLSVSISGGLRVPNRGGWVEGYGPQITIFGFDIEADVCIMRVADGHTFFDQPQRTNTPFSVPWPGLGDYRVEASSAGHSASPRLIKILSWQDLRLTIPERRDVLRLVGHQICGALVEPAQEGDH
jgi:hypothetical protein